MNLDAIGPAAGQGVVLGPVEILITVLTHSSIVQRPADPFIMIEALRIVRDQDQSIRGMGSTHTTHVATLEDRYKLGVGDLLADL